MRQPWQAFVRSSKSCSGVLSRNISAYGSASPSCSEYIIFNKKVTHFIAVIYVYFKPLLLKEVAPPGKGLTVDCDSINA